jgi:signal transduction histidine kinase/ligand-binding sensor domain-containing protein/CheY-like chemotaxis protein/AraC-like DNA-binding protein
LLLFICLSLFSQNKVRYLTIDQGLANNTITCISRDHKGFMWFGTFDGLNRYDGYVFKKYSHVIGDSTSLRSNLISTIAEDNAGRHWVVAGPGVSVLDDKATVFSRVKYLPFNHTGAKQLEASVNSVVNDGHGNMLVGAKGAGLIVFRNGNMTGQQLALLYHGKMIADYTVKTLYTGRDGQTWIAVDKTGIGVYDAHAGIVIIKYEGIINVNCFQQVHNDTLLAGTANTLYQYAISSSRLSPYKLQNGDTLKSGLVRSLCEDEAGRCWVGCDGNGINIIDVATHRLVPIENMIGHQTISSNAIDCLYKDADQRIWIGTLRGGVNMIDHGQKPFYSVKLENDNKNPANNFIFSFCEDKNGDIWIGTDGGGISVWNRKTNQFKKYTAAPGKNGLASNNISDLAMDDDGNILVAEYQSDILRFNRNTRTFQKVLTTGPEASGFAWRFYKDPAGDIWAACRGLFKYDKRTGTLVSPVNPVPGAFLALTGDRNNHLWLGNWDQVICIDKEGKSLLTYKTNAQVRSILAGKDGAVWVGTQGSGLLKYYNGRWKMYTEKEGLANNNVLNILEDNNGAIWMSTFNGISKFTPASATFENYFAVDGLQSNQFYYNAALKPRSGELMFGGINGFTIFKPEACVPEQSFPPLGITGIRILNQPVQRTGGFVKGASLYVPDEIKLPYSKSFISIDFAAMEYSLPGKIQYAYFLEGWDKTWSLPGSGRTANYSELKEGNYVLRIRSTNTSGIWNTKELRLPIIVLPPWYRTWWFRLSMLLVVVGIMAALLYYWDRERRIKYKMKIAELKHQHELELNEKRLSFFTNISHEFRSPLTLIINPINEIIKSGTATADDYNLRVVQSNAQRLLKITDQLLLFRKADNEFGKMEPVNLDLLNLCRQVFYCFSDEAALKNLTYDLNCGLEQAPVFADAEKIEIIIFNLIANAIKFSPQQGRVCVKLEEQNDRFIIAVSDNGPGVPANIGDKLFDKFYQVPDKQTAGSAKGFGIGLYLSKAFADMHEADLSYSCPPSGGTIFSFGLKKVNESAHPVFKVPAEKIIDSNLPVQAFLNDPVTTTNRKDDYLSELVGEKKVMLVIDNDRQLTAYIKNLFSYLTVYEAENGIEGWKKVQELVPDIIICDIVMDESNGIEVCKKIKSSSSYGHIPVVLLTGCSAADMRLKGLECGADDYILKPFESELVIARVNNILKDREALKKFFFNEITLQAAEPLKVADEFRGFLADCIALVEAHIERDDFDSKVFAKKMGMSRSKLYTKVKAISGLSVNEFVKLIRLRKAAELMIKTDGQVKEIAFQVGFHDPKYFSEQFTRLFQLKPSEYIKKYRDSFQNKAHLNDQFSRIKKK